MVRERGARSAVYYRNIDRAKNGVRRKKNFIQTLMKKAVVFMGAPVRLKRIKP